MPFEYSEFWKHGEVNLFSEADAVHGSQQCMWRKAAGRASFRKCQQHSAPRTIFCRSFIKLLLS
jgi:hypothetical protein